jgi:glutathione reductase (NADPH)
MAATENKTHYDLLVIGCGSGGLGAARRAASYGAKVAIIERGALGGTCVNVGCVPKKVMFNTAHIRETLHDAKDYGFDFSAPAFDWNKVKRARDAYVARLNASYGKCMSCDHTIAELQSSSGCCNNSE